MVEGALLYTIYTGSDWRDVTPEQLVVLAQLRVNRAVEGGNISWAIEYILASLNTSRLTCLLSNP